MNRTQQIRECLERTLSPTQLTVEDESAAHLGHAGAQSGGGHFSITIAAEALQNKSRVEAHRLIYAALGDMMKTDIHALRIKIVE
jgi:BolA protein